MYIVHTVPGRIRIKLERMKNDPSRLNPVPIAHRGGAALLRLPWRKLPQLPGRRPSGGFCWQIPGEKQAVEPGTQDGSGHAGGPETLLGYPFSPGRLDGNGAGGIKNHVS